MFNKIIIFIFLLILNISNSMAYTINIYGDSLALGYGEILKNKYKKYKSCKINNYGIISTGLLNQRNIDWFNRIKYLNSNTKPDIVILSFGANDAGLNINKNIKFNTEAWTQEYINRLENIINLIYTDNADTQIVFMSIPIFIKDKKRQENNNILNAIQDKVIDKYMLYKPELVDIQREEYKSQDGIHYNNKGYVQAVNIMIESNNNIKKELDKCR